jgi:putative spermidine/putrescine transport system substrate-binding protein
MWDKKYSGRIFLPPPQWTEAMELTILAAQMSGGSERNPGPGWKKLAELKGRILTLGENHPQIAELFRADSLDLGGVYSPGLLGPKFLENPEYNMSITMNCEEGFFYDLQLMIVPKGHPGDADVIHAFMNLALDPVVQGKMADSIYYGCINQNAVLSDKAKKSTLIPSAKMIAEKGQSVDKDYLATVRQEWIKKFTEMFGM